MMKKNQNVQHYTRERDTEIDKGGWEVKRLNLPQLTRIQEAVAYWLCKLKNFRCTPRHLKENFLKVSALSI